MDCDGKIEVYYKDCCLASQVVDRDFLTIKSKKFQRTVGPNGIVKYRQQSYNVGSLLAGKKVVIQETCHGTKIAIYIDKVLFEEFDKKTKTASKRGKKK
jgi:hypothetical protein